MQKSAEKYIRKAQIYNEVLRERAALALLLSIVVVIGVFWCLKLTGIAMAGDANCGIVEHVHRDDCTVKTFTCTLPENAYHAHADECYSVSYTCGINEHIHTASCYSNTKADLETPSDWEATINEVNKKLDLSEDLVAVARTQIGYSESKINYQADDNGTKHGYTRYGEWYGSPYGEWQAMFVSFCLNYSGLPEGSLKFYSGIETMRADWSAQGIYKPISEHTPVLGDIIFLDTDGNEKADHVGIVSSEAGDSYKLIIGDYFDKVSEIEIKKDNSTVMGASVKEELLRVTIPDDEIIRKAYIQGLIDDLPTYEALVEIMAVFDENDDEAGYEGYISQLSVDSFDAYAYWKDLGIYSELISGKEKFDYLSSLWFSSMTTLSNQLDVYQINRYVHAKTTVVHTGKVSNYITNMKFTWWDAYYITQDYKGYYVSKIDTSNAEKGGYTPPKNGLIVFINSDVTWNVSVGDRVDIDFKFKGVTTAPTPAASQGKISLLKNTGLITVDSASTFDFVEINLFNYGSNINTLYNSDNKYPGFQQDNGSDKPSISQYGMNLGNNITVDLSAGKTGVTSNKTLPNINSTANGANSPIAGAMQYNLGSDGYPVMADGTSLKYLFSQSEYATKQNDKNIDGLFKFDPDTGWYKFNCRENHAQFDSETDTFILYEQVITPNFIMYPFGNFMPFNDIVSETTQVSTISSKTFTNMAIAARRKYANGGFGDEYDILDSALVNLRDKMTEKYGSGWDENDLLNAYFTIGKVQENIDSPVLPGEYLQNLYNIDYDKPKDFFFGMDIHMDFIMPKDGITGPNNDQDLVFEFTGDDDVWVYVDGKLFLDLSGIHRHVAGKIDFRAGRVYYYSFNSKTGQADAPIFIEKYGEYYVTFAQLGITDLNENGTFKNYSNHTIDFYYMERGAGSGVCEINFNLPILKKNSITVTKEVTGVTQEQLDTLLGNPDFQFQIMKADGSAPFVGENVKFDILNSDNSQKIGEGITGANGVFTLKAGQTAVFAGISEDQGSYYVRELLDPSVYEQYGSISVDGTATTINPQDVKVNEIDFKGYNSPIKNINENASISFNFHNDIDITKTGAFSITKQFNEYHEDGSAPKNVTFFLKLDGVDIPVGTKYTLHRADGTVEYLQLTTAGQVTFTSGDKVTFGNILAGSMLYIKEDGSSSGGYTVVYNVEDRFRFDEKNNILIVPSEEAKIDVVNDKIGTKEVISLDKTLLYPDGAKYTFDFALRQIQGLADMTPVPGGTYQTLSLPMSIGSAEFEFTLNYTSSDIGTYYYLIQELGAQEGNGKDLRRYIVEITTEMNAENTAVNVISKKYYLYNETENSASLLDDQQKLHFENRIVRNLTLEKVVNGIQPDSRKFTFTIDASIDGYPITGTYAVTGVEGVESITFSSNGKASLYLAHGEKATICGLPYGTVYSITESGYEGFYVRYRIDSGEFMIGDSTADTTLREDMQVQFLNTGGSELPTTGGRGQTVFILVGAVLMLSSTVILYILRRRSERRLKK